MSTALERTVRFAPAAGGARIAWASSGEGPVLVRTAHWMTHVEHDRTSPLWAPWLARLSRRLELVRYDGRGFGLSDGVGTPPDLLHAVEDLHAVVQVRGAPRVALLGISSGAAAAVTYAASHADRVSHLVLLGGFAQGMLRHDLNPEQRQLVEATFQLMSLGWGRRSPAVQQYFTTTMLPGASAEQAQALNEQQRLSCDGARAAALMRAQAEIDIRATLPALHCPTLVLHAARDAMVPVALGRDLAARIPGARFETLDTGNHVPLAGEPAFDRLCELVESFVGVAPGEGLAFSARERELLELVARGRDNLQIAAHLGLADKTVRNALSRLYATLGVAGRPQAVVKARALGFGASADT